ncbi:MAG: hypothetical protein RQ966_18525, partial [Acetobacteraceae bacterium]|nr:hypothetical protein [Acetobacteraceae bacterium]
RAARDEVNRAMPEIFDRPTAFTRNAVVAPRELAATKDRLEAIVTLRPIQAKYLLHEEIGGTRTPAENTRKPGAALVLPGKTLPLDAFGNIPSGALRQLKRDAAANRRARRKRAAATRIDETNTVVYLPAGAPGNQAGIGGFFRRLAGHALTRLTAFAAEEHYTPRFGYHARVERAARAAWPAAIRQRLAEAIATAR